MQYANESLEELNKNKMFLNRYMDPKLEMVRMVQDQSGIIRKTPVKYEKRKREMGG